MAVAILTGYATDSAKGLIGLVVARIGEEIKLAWGFKDDLHNLQQKLKRVEALLNSGAAHQTNPILEDWLNMVKDVAYDAEDLLDEYAYESLRRRLKMTTTYHHHQHHQRVIISFKTKLRFCVSWSSNPLLFRLRMAHAVQDLNKSISGIFNDAKDLGIKPVKVAASSSTTYSDNKSLSQEEKQLQQQREWVDYQGLIGRDDDETNMVRLLCDPTHQRRLLTVVGIVGMAVPQIIRVCRVRLFYHEIHIQNGHTLCLFGHKHDGGVFTHPYTQEQVEEVREMWANYFLEGCV